VIGPGDVQWMTAASGVVHEEFHSHKFAKKGGTLEMVQLWVNLPAKVKMLAPRYQEILSPQIPIVALKGNAGTVRVIAGEFQGVKGPAKTFTPVLLWDVRLKAGHIAEFSLPEGFTTALVVQRGSVTVNGSDTIGSVDLALFNRDGDRITVAATEDAMALLLCGQPIDEPIVGQGPFVMNTQEEIHQAIRDYQSGKMGHIAARV
jgi:redox-sensitive bicupin YhaK (pirin superfamily)